MEDTTRQAARCTRCGNLLAADAPAGLCAACLLALATETLTGSLPSDVSTMPSDEGLLNLDDEGHELTPGQTWGGYRIGRLLGRGGMGEVYEADHLESGRRLALKVLRVRLRSPQDSARFLREGQLAASVSHPHTVYVFGSEEIDGLPVIAMELLPGGTLKDRVVAQGPLAPSDAAAAILDVIGGLDAAQAAGILHRDIKPSNCFTDSDGTVKVGDFGLSISTLARDIHQELTLGGFQGTPQYAAPEQLRGEPLDVRADIYAVGATLYYLLTGAPPFDGRDLRDLVDRVTTDAPRNPRAARPEIPAGLAAVVLRCLAKTPADRPASYAELAEALRPFTDLDHAPARLGLRFMAGVIDGVLVSLPFTAWQMLNFSAIMQAGPGESLRPWVWAIGATYYLLLEGFTGASLGKRALGLRLRAGARELSWLQVASRTAIFHVPHLLVALWLPLDAIMALIPTGPIAGNLSLNSADMRNLVRGTVTLAGVALLFVTARRSNGFTALHDRVSGLQVVSRAPAHARLRPRVPAIGTAVASRPAATTVHRFGPYVVTSGLAAPMAGEVVLGVDLVLRRRVWIHVVAPGTAAIDAVRRDTARPGRLRWLTGRRSSTEQWDAYEAPDGAPIVARLGADLRWPALKSWLLDLTRELQDSAKDGLVTALGPDRLWVREDGRLLVLDFVPPGSPGPASAATLTPIGLLADIAARAVTHGVTAGPGEVPLSARRLLTRLAAAPPSSLAAALDELTEAAKAPDVVTRTRRAVPIVLAAAPIAVLLAAGISALPLIFRLMSPEYASTMNWLQALHGATPGSRFADPEVRTAVEHYLVSRYSAAMRDDTFWTIVNAQPNITSLRRLATDILDRRPTVSPEEFRSAEVVLEPELARVRARPPARAPSLIEPGGVILSGVAWMAVLFVLACTTVSAIAVPGGVLTRLLGLAVVTRDGLEIGRARSLARTVIAWLPAIVWLIYLTAAPTMQGWVPNPASPLLAMSLTLGVLTIGGAWTIANPSRGVHDRLAGTWVVPR